MLAVFADGKGIERKFRNSSEYKSMDEWRNWLELFWTFVYTLPVTTISIEGKYYAALRY